MAEAKEHPTPRQMSQGLNEWWGEEDSEERKNARKLITATKLKELLKALDPNGRMQADVHDAICKDVAKVLKKALMRAYDNKRMTIRPSDL